MANNAEPEFTVKIVDGKAVYTKVASKEKAAPQKAVTAPKRSLGCRSRYNSYVKERTAKGHTAISADKWMAINC